MRQLRQAALDAERAAGDSYRDFLTAQGELMEVRQRGGWVGDPDSYDNLDAAIGAYQKAATGLATALDTALKAQIAYSTALEGSAGGARMDPADRREQIREAYEQLSGQLGRKPNQTEIGKAVGLSRARVNAIMQGMEL